MRFRSTSLIQGLEFVRRRPALQGVRGARQDLVLEEAGIEDPVVFEEDPGTSSRLHPLQRPKFGELLTYGRPGETVHISEMFRLVRGNQHILDVLDVLHRDRLALRIHDGAFSAMDLTARHPRTGELLSTVKFMVQTLAAAGELQRDLQRELTYDGLRAAEAKGAKGGRRPAVAAARTADVRTAYLRGRSIAALARDHRVSRGAIRTAVAVLLPDHTASEEDAPTPELPITLDMPGTRGLPPHHRTGARRARRARPGDDSTTTGSELLGSPRRLIVPEDQLSAWSAKAASHVCTCQPAEMPIKFEPRSTPDHKRQGQDRGTTDTRRWQQRHGTQPKVRPA
ncbi:recombinase family protein [Streptomyces sp. NPDC088183]|uniref:recombinase family protein n=2 Tax=Streptomyces TaxID=1883 RepID=UPI003432075B